MQMRPEYLLLPVSRAFIAASIAVAFVLNILPWGRVPVVPDFLALVLVFWNVHQPRKVGIGIAFVTGLLMDVHAAALLGEHALAYTLLSYGAISMHRRVPFFRPAGQVVHVLPLFVATQLLVLLVRLALGASAPPLGWFAQGLVTALLWPLARMLLLAPQRRAVHRDVTRPL